MAQKILGLDLGAHAVKAVLLEGSYRSFTVAGAARVPVAPNGEGEERPLRDRQIAAVRELLADRGWRADTVVAAFPGAAVSSHVVTLPFTDPRRIEQTVSFEVEGQIPFELDQVAWDWQPLGVREGRTDLFVGVVRKEELAGLLAALAEAGIDPRAVVPAGPAYAALFAGGAVAAPPPAEPALEAPGTLPAAEILVDVGRERTSACVVVGGGCEAARTFAFGTAHLARAVARELAVSEEEAAAIVAAGAGGAPLPPSLAEREADPRLADALRRALAPLVRELRATLRAWHARVGPRPVSRVVLAGDLARLPLLAEALAPEIQAPVVPLELAGPAAAVPPADAPALALALALAVRAQQGSHAPRLNLRRGELAFTRDFQHLRGKIVRLAAYAGLVLLLAILSAAVKSFALSRQEGALDRSLCDAEQKILGKCFDNFEQAESILRGRGATGAATVPKTSAVDVFAELADRVPAAVPLRFDRIEITKDKLHLQGTTDAAENVDRIVSALRASRCFGDARSGGARKRGTDGKFEFSIDSALTCAGEIAPHGGGKT